MKILMLEISGFKKIKAFFGKFNEKGITKIAGKNQQGKTSILDALIGVFVGGSPDASTINNDSERACVTVKIDGYTVQRVITKTQDRITLTKEGGKLAEKNPKTFLKSLINNLTANPLPFLQKTALEKLRFLMEILHLDFKKIDEEIEKLKQERLNIGRQVEAFGDIQDVERVDPVDISLLINSKIEIEAKNKKLLLEFESQKNEKIAEIIKHNDLQAQRQKQIDDQNERKKNRLRQMAEHAERIEALKKEIETLNNKSQILALESRNEPFLCTPEPLMDITNHGIAIPELEDTSHIDDLIVTAGAINKQAEFYQTFLRRIDEKNKLSVTYKTLDNKIRALRDTKLDILSQTKMPIEGLKIVLENPDRPDGIYYNGIHCDGWSTSQSMRISLALCLALQPKLRAVFLDGAEAFDSDTLAEIHQWGVDNDIQLFVTVVQDNADRLIDGVDYYIEDGEAVAIND